MQFSYQATQPFVYEFGKIYLIQECIPVGCVPPKAAAVMGALHTPPQIRCPPEQASPQSRNLLGQAALEQAPSRAVPPVKRMTDRQV